jgi:diacylglycerol kinase
VLARVSQGSVLAPMLFNTFINDLCDVINHSNCNLSADNIKDIGCSVLQSFIVYTKVFCKLYEA